MRRDTSNNSLSGQIDSNLFLHFCRHLVALCITFQSLNDEKVPISELKFDAFPGIIINIRGIFYFLTAGHILKNLDTELSNDKVLIHNSVLADTFGPGTISPHPIPFDFSNEPKFYIFDKEDGLDFGLIMLRSYYVDLLDKHGIAAIFEQNWIHQSRIDFDDYAMLGLPDEFISAVFKRADQHLSTLGSVSPTLIQVQKPAVPPENLKETKFNRFIGQLKSDMPLWSIVGMSGGPIFGINHGPPERYWIVAIQSVWLETRKIIFGCPLPVLANLLTDWTDQILRTERNEQQPRKKWQV